MSAICRSCRHEAEIHESECLHVGCECREFGPPVVQLRLGDVMEWVPVEDNSDAALHIVSRECVTEFPASFFFGGLHYFTALGPKTFVFSDDPTAWARAPRIDVGRAE